MTFPTPPVVAAHDTPSLCLVMGHRGAHKVVEFPEAPGVKFILYGCGRCGQGFGLTPVPTTSPTREVEELRERVAQLEAEVDKKRAAKPATGGRA